MSLSLSQLLSVWALWALIRNTEDCFPFGESRKPWPSLAAPTESFPPNRFLPEIKSACLTRREKVGAREAVVSVSTLHYVIGHKYLTVGIICKYFIKMCMSSPLVPHGPLLVRFTNDNINTLKKRKKEKEIQFSFEKNWTWGGAEGWGLGGGGGVGRIWLEQQNSGGLCNEVWKVCSVFGGQGLLDLPEGLSSKRTQCQELSRAVQAFTTNYLCCINPAKKCGK